MTGMKKEMDILRSNFYCVCVLRPKFHERKKVARKISEKNSHWKVMVNVRGLSLKDTKEEEEGFWSESSTVDRMTVVFSSVLKGRVH
jgi:hypothetical protein